MAEKAGVGKTKAGQPADRQENPRSKMQVEKTLQQGSERLGSEVPAHSPASCGPCSQTHGMPFTWTPTIHPYTLCPRPQTCAARTPCPVLSPTERDSFKLLICSLWCSKSELITRAKLSTSMRVEKGIVRHIWSKDVYFQCIFSQEANEA